MNKIEYNLLLIIAITNLIACVPNMDLNNPEEISIDTYYLNQEQLESAIIPAYQSLFGVCQGGYAVGAFNILRKYLSVSGKQKELSVTGLKNPEIIKVAV